MEYRIENIEELYDWADIFLTKLDKKEIATIITLSGDLGAGKTTLVQQIAKHLKITDPITSPTFVIQKEYEIHNHSWIQQLIHIDAYRMESKSELEYLGWNELIQDPAKLIVMEWPEMVSGITLPSATNLSLTINSDHSRTIKVH